MHSQLLGPNLRRGQSKGGRWCGGTKGGYKSNNAS